MVISIIIKICWFLRLIHILVRVDIFSIYYISLQLKASFLTVFMLLSTEYLKYKSNYSKLKILVFFELNKKIHWQSIERAHENIKPGYIYWNEGELLDSSINRSPAAYLNNPKEERDKLEMNSTLFYWLVKINKWINF
jgi:hypothetical protein